MTQLCDFLHFNDTCPVCGKTLTLYMHVSKSTLWKAKRITQDTCEFQPFLLIQKEYSEDDYMSLYDFGAEFKTVFNSKQLRSDAKTWQLYFFKICGTESFTDNKYDYDINLYDACYHRSSPWFEFKNCPDDVADDWQLKLSNPDHADLINRDESFCFKKNKEDGVEKVYALSLDYEVKATKLWYYSTTPDLREQANFEPNIFQKDDLPLLRQRPDLTMDARDQLISRMDSWIVLS